MKRHLALLATPALAIASLTAHPQTAAAATVYDCPADFRLQAPGDPELPERLADRNGDGTTCAFRFTVLGRTAQILTDNAVGDPHIIPPGPCVDPWLTAPAAAEPHLREIDLNADGITCALAFPRVLTLVVVDNPNQIPHA